MVLLRIQTDSLGIESYAMEFESVYDKMIVETVFRNL